MGFTQEAVNTRPDLLLPGQDRAWDVWDAAPDDFPSTKTAFRLLFPTAELAVTPQQRAGRQWNASKKVLYIDAAPAGEMVVLSVLISPQSTRSLNGEFISVLHLATLALVDSRRVHILAHHSPVGIYFLR